jgi:peptidylprolyl isomerase
MTSPLPPTPGESVRFGPPPNTGLVGQRAGSRVLLVIPPADAYGAAGSSQAGINGTDTLVFAVDILAAS